MKRFYTLFVILLTLTSYLNTAHPQVEFTPVSNRTLQVQDAIVAAVDDVNAAADVTEAHVASITVLNLHNVDITTLNAGDFDGFTALTELKLHHNDLSALPADIFDGLTALTELRLNDNDLSALPDGIFDELTALRRLHLHDNNLSALPAGIFDGLVDLRRIYLQNNALSTLPASIFSNLTNLTILHLHGNPIDPMPLTVFLESVGEKQFKAVTPTGAPFDIVLPLNITEGSITGGASSVTIATGRIESNSFTVTRTQGTLEPMNVDIGTLPALPSNHDGYTLVKHIGLPLEIIEIVPVSSRTPQVRDAIVAALPDVNSANDVTEAHLASITNLYIYNVNLVKLKRGDFSGLTALIKLTLLSNPLTTLPEGIFNQLTELRYLIMSNNQLSMLPAGIFDKLTKLLKLELDRNAISVCENATAALPEGIFDNLTNLTLLALNDNELSVVPEGIFDKLTNLQALNLGNNPLNALPEGIFENLTWLGWLYMYNTELSALPDDIFENLTNLTFLSMGGNNLSALPDDIFENLTNLTVVSVSSDVVGSLPLTVSLEKVEDGQFKAVAPTGAPFDLVLPLNITNGSITGGASSITISTGRIESDTLTLTRTQGTTAAVTVDIGTFPALPTDDEGDTVHEGYTLVKSADLPLEAIGAVQGAPALRIANLLDPETLQTRDPAILEAKLDALRAESNGSLKYIQSIAWLESVLANLHPEKTRLLANYPNPFNPETWIPYHLANASDVQITLYNAQGSIVRRLDLGHQPGGYYTGRSRAAHWDGRNHIGEPVASGTYFYQLQADNVSLLRKMVILK